MHRENTDWLRRVENHLDKLTVQDDIHIEAKTLSKQVRKMPNWKSPGTDGVCRDTGSENVSNLHNETEL